MSVHISSLVYRAKLGGSIVNGRRLDAASRKAVALKLADCAHDDGSNVYPSIARIAAEAEVSDRTVQRVLRSFVDEGILEVVSVGGRGPRSTTEYRFNVDLLLALCSSANTQNKGDPRSPTNDGRVTRGHKKGDPGTPKGDPGTPEPSLTVKEPSLSAQARERVSKSENLKAKGKAMDCAISPEARNVARTLAPGWDVRELEREWREWNEAQDNVVKDPDRAFLAFCRKRGAHKAARKFKLTTKVSPELRALVLVAGPDERIIDRLGPHWQPWLDHLRREAPDLERQACRSFAIAVKSPRPYPGCDLPRIQPMPTTA